MIGGTTATDCLRESVYQKAKIADMKKPNLFRLG
jgi:hypothetical protein